jgi:ABC-type transport system involved in multi-copper enzyme maturation permease subunit
MSTALPAREARGTLPLLRGAREIFALSFDGLVWGRRSAFMALLLGLPVVFAVLYRFVLAARLPARVSGFDLYGVIVAIYDLRNVVPLCALFFASALVAEEVEGRTLTYLLTRPVQRASILLGKFAAYVATVLALTLPATVVTFFLLATAGGLAGVGSAVPDLLRDLGVIALALVVYGALFALLGVALRRPVVPGLLFLFAWELVANLPGYLPRLTITAYLRSLLRHRPPEAGLATVFGEVLPAPLCVGVLTSLSVLLLAGAIGIFSRREYVLEQ